MNCPQNTQNDAERWPLTEFPVAGTPAAPQRQLFCVILRVLRAVHIRGLFWRIAKWHCPRFDHGMFPYVALAKDVAWQLGPYPGVGANR